MIINSLIFIMNQITSNLFENSYEVLEQDNNLRSKINACTKKSMPLNCHAALSSARRPQTKRLP